MTTKAELLEAVAAQAGTNKADAEKVLAAFFDTVVKSTKKGEKVAWPGFGHFSTTKTKARTGRNPQTGGAVKIPASTRIKFTASSTLKASLNPKKGAAAAKAAPAKKAAPAAKAAPAKKAAPAAKAAPAKKATPAKKAAKK